MNRRQFLQAVPVVATGLALGPDELLGSAPAKRIPLGIQFGGPKATPEATKAAMEEYKRIGYEMIEPVSTGSLDPKLFRKQAEEVGVRVRSVHIGAPVRGMGQRPPGAASAPPPKPNPTGAEEGMQPAIPGGPGVRRAQRILDMQDNMFTPDGIVAIAKDQAPLVRDLGAEYGVLAASGISDYASIDAIKRMADAHNQAYEILKAVGVKLSYHSHELDFWPVEGRIGYDVLMENTNPAIKYQLDIGWAAVGGADPVAVINKYSKRLALFHMRDYKDENVLTAGEGTLNWPALFAAISKIPDPLCYVENGDVALAYKNLRAFGWGHPA